MNELLLICILIFLIYDRYFGKKDKHVFLVCVTLALVLQFIERLDIVLSRPEYMHLLVLKTVRSYIGYIIRPALLWGMWEILRGEKKKSIRRIFVILTIGNILIFSTCFFSRLTFYYDPITYHWGRGPWGLTAHYVMAIMMFLFLPTLWDMYHRGKKNDFALALVALIGILCSVYLDTWQNMSTLPNVVTIICLIYFLFFHIELESEYTKALIVAQKAEMMLMQIKPHFINNTLGTIQALCEIDPPLAARTTGNFARYLRMNLTAMDKPLPIPIEEEMAHTKTYLEIEKLRFPWIEVEYDIQDTNFCVPPLTIQPLVENSIQHGLRKRKRGMVRISTKETEKGHRIVVEDNGVGFDQKNPVVKEGHGVGVKNVRYRIETVCNGSMRVESDGENGTKITIYLP